MADDAHILILRGLVRDQRHWGPFASILQERLRGGRVVGIDFPGVGTEWQRNSPTTIEGIMEDTRARFLPLAREIGGTWRIFAVSMGGMVAQAWAAAHPGDFAGVVICNSSASNLSRTWERMRPGMWPRVLRGFVADDATLQRNIVHMTTRMQSPAQEEALVEAWTRFQRERTVAPRTAAAQLWAASTWRAPDHLDVPVLVLASLKDALCSYRCSQRLAEHHRAPLKLHAEAGHDLPLDDAAWVADQVAEWLGDQRARP